MRKIPATMATQHPDNACAPFWEKDGDGYISVYEELDECMVCFNAEPNTIVRPCGHQVVCAACSPQLIGTIDEKICLQCRRPISSIEYI